MDHTVEYARQPQAFGVQIVDYEPRHGEAFRRLNEEWISTYFELEAPDRAVLEHPQQHILDRAGFILVATLDDVPVGVCALLRRDDLDGYELAKMAVAPEARGRSIGLLLARAAIAKALSMRAKRVYLESNTRLAPAIRLYEKLGFKRIAGPPSAYQRVDIQMELPLPPPRPAE